MPQQPNSLRHTKSDSHLKLTPSETRIWNQYQLTPNKKQTAEILGIKLNTVGRVLNEIREKLRAQES